MARVVTVIRTTLSSDGDFTVEALHCFRHSFYHLPFSAQGVFKGAGSELERGIAVLVRACASGQLITSLAVGVQFGAV